MEKKSVNPKENNTSPGSEATNHDNSAPQEPISHENFLSLFEKARQLKDEGNKDSQSKFDKALEKYQKSIKVFLKQMPKYVFERTEFNLDWTVKLSPEDEKQARELFAIVFSNTSLIYLEKHQPLIAFFYAGFSIWCNDAFYKGGLRRARAMLELYYFYDAEELLLGLKNKVTDAQLLQEIEKLLTEAQKLIQEYSAPKKVVEFLTGQLDFPLEQTFKGPWRIENIPGKGRGVVAARDIPQGTTLLIEKGIIYRGEQKGFCKHFLSELDRREDIKLLYMNLFTCSDFPLEKNEDTEKEFDLLLKDKKKKWKHISGEEVENFLSRVQCYTYQVNNDPGLFAYQSLLNHSCDPNTCLWTSGDMTVTLANRDIKKGEEICTTYIGLTEDKVYRNSLLIKYRFKCDCVRCNGVGAWKEKEPQLTGLRCPKCQGEVACDEDQMFVCSKGCWKTDRKYSKKLEEEITSKLDELMELAEKNEDSSFKEALEILKKVEDSFGQCHYLKAYALRTLGKFYSYKKQEKEFLECFWKVVEIVKFYANPALRTMITGLLYELCLNFGREPSSEELEPFVYFGLRLDVTKGLWKRSVAGNK